MIDATRESLLAALAELSEMAPDMRFGQAISNLVTKAKSPGTQTEWAEAVWDIEDSELLAEVNRTASLWRESYANSDPAVPMSTGRPTGDGRTPENVRRTWAMMIETMIGFAEANAAILRNDRDREAIASLIRALDRPATTSTPTRKTSIAS